MNGNEPCPYSRSGKRLREIKYLKRLGAAVIVLLCFIALLAIISFADSNRSERVVPVRLGDDAADTRLELMSCRSELAECRLELDEIY